MVAGLYDLIVGLDLEIPFILKSDTLSRKRSVVRQIF